MKLIKKNTGEWSSERGVINQMCFCIIGNLVFFVCVVFFLRGSLKTIKMHTNTARDELLSAVLVTGCVCEGNFLFIYFWCTMNISVFKQNIQTKFALNVKLTMCCIYGLHMVKPFSSFLSLNANRLSWSDVLTTPIIDLPTPAYDP